MSKIVIASCKGHLLSALWEHRIQELRVDTPDETTPGLQEIYVGKVSAVKEALHAAFVDVRPGVTCYLDLKELDQAIFTSKISKQPIGVGDELLVQIEREALKTKLPSVSTNLCFYSKNVILTTGRTNIGISAKLDKETKERLLKLTEPYISEDYGFVLRTNAGQTEEKQIILEIERLIAQYRSIIPYASTRTCYSLVVKGDREYHSLLRDTGSALISEIVTDSKEVFEDLKEYLALNMPDCMDKLRFYDDPLLPLYKLYSMEQTILSTAREQIWLRSGAYLVIQPTEALTVVDVNSGKADTRKNKEQFLKINLEAAEEIAYQMRLRNLSGIILVDFINMETEEERNRITDCLRQKFRTDTVKTSYIDTTGLQLVEITRKKVRKPLRDYIYIFKEN